MYVFDPCKIFSYEEWRENFKSDEEYQNDWELRLAVCKKLEEYGVKDMHIFLQYMDDGFYHIYQPARCDMFYGDDQRHIIVDSGILCFVRIYDKEGNKEMPGEYIWDVEKEMCSEGHDVRFEVDDRGELIGFNFKDATGERVFYNFDYEDLDYDDYDD